MTAWQTLAVLDEPGWAWWLILAFAILMTAVGRAWWGHIDENRSLRADVAVRDEEIELLKTFIDQQAESHAASAAEWADRCRAANAVAIALDPYSIERTS